MLLTCNNTACGGIREPNAVAFSSNYGNLSNITECSFKYNLALRAAHGAIFINAHNTFGVVRTAPKRDVDDVTYNYGASQHYFAYVSIFVRIKSERCAIPRAAAAIICKNCDQNDRVIELLILI